MKLPKVTFSQVFPRAGVTAVALAILCTAPAHAQKLYKVVDENGNVSYQDTPPAADTDKVEKKYASRKGMHLRKTAPAGQGDGGYESSELLDEKGRDIIEEDAPDLVPSESVNANTSDLDPDAETDGPLPSSIMEIPAHRRKGAIGDFRRTQETIEQHGGVVPEKRAKIKVVPPKRKRLSKEELNDIARSANQ